MPEAQVVVTVPQEQLRRTGQEPDRGWPAYGAPYPMGDPKLVPRDPIFISEKYRDLVANHGWVAGARMDPLTRALSLTGAERVDAGDFRTLGANSGLLRPLVGGD